MGFGFPNPNPAWSGRVSSILCRSLASASISCRFPFYFWVCSGVPCSTFWPPATFAWFPACMNHSWTWSGWSLKIKQLSWTPPLSRTITHGILLSRSPRVANSALLKSRTVILLFAFLPSLWAQTLHDHCSQAYHWPSHLPPILSCLQGWGPALSPVT